MAFTHLHFHTSYSLLDGYNPIKKAVARVKELGQTACAITDHGNLGGCPSFRDECIEQGIKSLLGMEGYYTPDMKQAGKPLEERRQDAVKRAIEAGVLSEESAASIKKADLNKTVDPFMYNMHQYHILYIAKNNIGWRNLVKIQSESARLCTYNGRYLADMDLLRKYHEGIICTSACIGSFPAKMVEEGNYDAAEEYIVSMKEIFGDDFYLEIQPLDIKQQHATNLFYMEMASKHGIKAVATNDVHYTLKEDWDDHDTLLCIGTGKKKSEQDRMKYSHDFWIKSEEEMFSSFESQASSIRDTYLESGGNPAVADEILEEYADFYSEALDNTQEVVDKCEDDIQLGSDKPLFSHVKTSYGRTPEQELHLFAWRGLYAYLVKHPEYNRQEYENRLHDEMEVICPKGFAPYMLAVREYVNWANSNGAPTGPGRGSAAGSLCLFCLGITKNIDPIQNKLLFSRFLTAGRNEMPDVDVDFLNAGRDRVIEHLEDYYGKECVCHVGTYSEMGVKSGLKDVCRVLEVPFLESNDITKAIGEINDSPNAKFKDFDAMKEGDENEQKQWEKFHDLETKYHEVFRLARAFEGTPRNQGVHASAILVTPMPVTDLFPVRYKDGMAVAIYTGTQLEHYGAVKYDFLGLKTIDVIVKAIENIPDIENIFDLYDKADINDSNIWKYIADKNTDGVFQVESNMMKGIIDIIKPTCFDDLGAINALGRPGPLSAGLPQQYGDVKNGKKKMEYPIRDCEDILDETYGGTIYQEQLMIISKKISGFDDTQADSITRKILGKKKVELMPMMRRCHIFGKKNCDGPEGWENDDNAPWYDPKGKYGGEIPGALANGYTKEELLSYFDKIEGFAKYAFNRSHSACYAYVGFLCAWLKYYYPEQFMAATLSIQDNAEEVSHYVEVCRKMGIKVAVPDINVSRRDFTPDPGHHRILYGLSAVKGLGDAAIDDIVSNAPYSSLEDAMERIPKKAFNKRVAEGLIKAGGFDWLNNNRIELLNELHALRKDKAKDKDGRTKKDRDGNAIYEYENPVNWDEARCMEFEDETLGTHITFHTWWENLDVDEKASFTGKILSVREHKQKNGKMMAFVAIKDNETGAKIDCCIFAKQYAPLNSLFFQREGKSVTVSGKKSEKGSFIIDDAAPCRANEFSDTLDSIAI